MFENLKAGDTIRIGEKEFKTIGDTAIRNCIGIYEEKHWSKFVYNIEKDILEFLGAEIVRKAPPKYTPVKSGLGSFALSSGKFDQFGHLLVLVDNYFENWPIWEVLEVEK